jgi:hypothetical protein
VLAEAQFILHGWLRSGNTGAARGVVPFLQEALAFLPAGTWLRTVRADSGFFDGSFLDFLEARDVAVCGGGADDRHAQAPLRRDQGLDDHG